jgi:hypothetical protein
MNRPKIRVKFVDLPGKDTIPESRDLENILKNVTGQAGDKCERNCDCSFGLVCSNGQCTEDW